MVILLSSKNTYKERCVVELLRLFRSFMSADRNRRRRVVGFSLWLLRIVRDIEEIEMYRCSDQLDMLELYNGRDAGYYSREYIAIEEKCSNCEHALGFLECAIDDLGFAY